MLYTMGRPSTAEAGFVDAEHIPVETIESDILYTNEYLGRQRAIKPFVLISFIAAPHPESRKSTFYIKIFDRPGY